MVNEWTRDDLFPRREIVALSRETHERGLSTKGFADAVLDEMVEHLNEHHPKPCANRVLVAGQSPAWVFRALDDDHQQALAKVERERDDLRRQVEDLHERRRKHADERAAWTRNRRELISERDAAVERAEAAERERDEARDDDRLHLWGRITRHPFFDSTQFAGGDLTDAMLAALDEAHHPKPTPVPMGRAANNMLRETLANVERERDEALEASALFQQDAHKWRTKAEAAPAVTRAQVEVAIKWPLEGSNITLPEDLFQEQVDEVCRLLSIETVPDPVEKKARELWDVARPSDDVMWRELTSEAQQEYRRIAAHVLGEGS